MTRLLKGPQEVAVSAHVLAQLAEKRKHLKETYKAAFDNLAKELNDLAGIADEEEDLEARIMSLHHPPKQTQSRMFPVFLAINGTKFGKPTPSTKGALKHEVQLHYRHEDFSYLDVSAVARGTDDPAIDDKRMGYARVQCKNITAIDCKELDEDTAATFIKECDSSALNQPKRAYLLTVTAECSHACAEHLAQRALLKVDRTLQQHLLAFRQQASRKSSEGGEPVTFEMVIPIMHATIGKELLGMTKRADFISLRDKIQDPLAMYFTHAPKARTMFADKAATFHYKVEPLPRMVHWDRHQLTVYHVTGSVHDFLMHRRKAHALRSFDFQVSTVPLPHTEDNALFMLIVRVGDRGAYTPKDGESCLINSDDFEFPTELVTEEELPQETLDDCLRHLFVSVQAANQASVERRIMRIRELAPELIKLTDEEVSDLWQKYDKGYPEEVDEWEDRVKDVLRPRLQPTFGHEQDVTDLEPLDFDDIAQPMASGEQVDLTDDAQPETSGQEEAQVDSTPTGVVTDKDGNKWLSAYRQDVPLPFLATGTQIYIVSKPRGPMNPKTKQRPVIDVKIPMSETVPGESITSHIKRCQENTSTARIKRDVSDKTLATEVGAINYLVYPKSCNQNGIPSQVSLDAYEFLLDFNADPAKTINLLQELPGIKRVMDQNPADSPPEWVLDPFRGLDPIKQAVMKECLSALAHRVGFVAGVAGSGKTWWFLVLIAAIMYGECPADKKPQDAPKPQHAVLIILPSNEAVNKTVEDTQRLYQGMGLGDNAPPVVRLFSMESEVNTMTSRGQVKQLPRFNDENAKAESEQLSLGDHLMAQYQILKLTTETLDARMASKSRKNRLRDASLHAHAFQYLLENQENYSNLWRIVEQVDVGTSLTAEQRMDWKMHTKELYQDFLQQFRGVICATPVAAANATVREFLHPVLVVMDEAPRMRELSTFIGIVWYSPKAWLFVGDVRQLRPHVNTPDDEDDANPFHAALKTSVMGRAVDDGVVTTYLNANFRQYGDLVSCPSEIAYLGQMTQGYNDRFPVPVKNWVKYCQSLTKDHLDYHCRLIQELPGSRTTKIGRSTANPMHVQWTMARVKEILRDKSLTGVGVNANRSARILILPFYQAQMQHYLIEIQKLKDSKELSEDDVQRIRVLTLDSSQGDQEDIVIGDLSQTDVPGFCGEPERINLLLTRPIIGQLVLMEKGMWLVSDRSDKVVRQALCLRELYLSLKTISASPPRSAATGARLSACTRPQSVLPRSAKTARRMCSQKDPQSATTARPKDTPRTIAASLPSALAAMTRSTSLTSARRSSSAQIAKSLVT